MSSIVVVGSRWIVRSDRRSRSLCNERRDPHGESKFSIFKSELDTGHRTGGES